MIPRVVPTNYRLFESWILNCSGSLTFTTWYMQGIEHILRNHERDILKVASSYIGKTNKTTAEMISIRMELEAAAKNNFTLIIIRSDSN